MSNDAIVCLLLMALLGSMSIPMMPSHLEIKNGYRTKRQRQFWIAWAVFWGVPPLAAIWIKGVMG